MSRDDLLQLIPAYVLDALDDDERNQVEGLLADDAEAQAIERDYRQISQVLPLMATSRQPSADLKDRLLQRIHDEAESSSQPNNIVEFPEKRKRSSRRFMLPTIAAVIVIAIAGLVFVLSSSVEPVTPQSVFRSIYNQPDSAHVSVTPSEDSPVSADLLISNDNEQAVLRVRQMPALNEDQTFQLWLIDDYGSKSGGIYQADYDGELYLVIPNEKPIDTYIRFGMSIEPAGGSPLGDAPSGNRVFAVDVPTDTTQDQ